MEKEVFDIKAIIKREIDLRVPSILRVEDEIEEMVAQKKSLEAQVTDLRASIEEKTNILQEHQEVVLTLFTDANITRVLTPLHIVKRCQSTTPSVDIIDESLLSDEYIILKPKVNKRQIQLDYTQRGTTPAGVKIEFSQYLEIHTRGEKNGNSKD